ncbi:hypothetical protein K7432_002176 [Basidiobolus ranarum]|uniref:Uncharacterized protein n=1 Tax=Basidiobolus ranarum TaxID=34480 RepID=A0ABR2W8F7_9FUNG
MTKYESPLPPKKAQSPCESLSPYSQVHNNNFKLKNEKCYPNQTSTSLLTTYHPALDLKATESISHMQPVYGPGSMEYELAADYVRSSTKSRMPTLWGTDIPNVSMNSFHLEPEIGSLGKQSIVITNPVNTYRSTYFPYIVNQGESHYYWGKEVEENDETALVYQKESVEVPKGALLFLFGFLLFPLWWIGAIYPRNPQTKSQHRWKVYNRMTSVCSLPLLGFVIGLIVWNMNKYRTNIN